MKKTKLYVICLIGLWCGIVAAVSDVSACELNLNQCKNNPYVHAGKHRLDQVFEQFKNLLNNTLTNEQVLMNDFVISRENQYVLLTEARGRCQGKGSYAVNYEAENKILLQSPHSFYDTATGLINKRLFALGQVYSSAWNNVSRKASNHSGYGSSDLSKNPDSYFMRFSLAFAQLFPEGYIVQLHGFDRKKRKTAAGRKADIIISNGSRFPSESQMKLFYCLKRTFPEYNVLLYPGDVNELGATRNSVGKQLREQGFRGFLHLEMSYGFRMRLKQDDNSLKLINDCLMSI